MRKRPHKLPSPESYYLSEQQNSYYPVSEKLNRTTFVMPSRKTSMQGAGGIMKKNRRIVIDA